MTQSLAFLPEEDVLKGFLELNEFSCLSFKPILKYIENSYIGLCNKITKKRATPRYPISTWNLHNRIVNNLPRTNNCVESWHSQISADAKSHLTLNKIISLFKNEQGNVEALLVHAAMDHVHKRKKSSTKKDELIANIIKNYDSVNVLDFLKNMSLLMGQ